MQFFFPKPWLYNPFTPFGPTVEKSSDKAFIDRAPIDIIKSGDVQDVPWIAGVTKEEGLYPGGGINIVISKLRTKLRRTAHKTFLPVFDRFRQQRETFEGLGRKLERHCTFSTGL